MLSSSIVIENKIKIKQLQTALKRYATLILLNYYSHVFVALIQRAVK